MDVKTLRSYVGGKWHTTTTDSRWLHNPCSEEVIALASSFGTDFENVVDYARTTGTGEIQKLTFRQRGEVLEKMSGALHAHRDELIALSMLNTGVTRKDAKFDLDGARDTLAYYGQLGRKLGDETMLHDGESVQLGRSPRLHGKHIYVPKSGVAVHINAFNFPAWGFAEKAAVALLAGMPIITKPATSTAMVAERCIDHIVNERILPDGALSFVCGSLGNLLSYLGPQDVLSFTGSRETATQLRETYANLRSGDVRMNVETDSLNTAVLGPDVALGSATWQLFIREVAKEMTQKTGQKCTAIRRIFVPQDKVEEVQAQLQEELERVIVGNPNDPSVTMGPLVTIEQLSQVIKGVTVLVSCGATLVYGPGKRVDGKANPAGVGYFFAPTMLRVDAETYASRRTNTLEIFGPVVTMSTYPGGAREAAQQVRNGGGSLVCALYSNDQTWLKEVIAYAGSWNGRFHIGSEKTAEVSLGSGLVLPQLAHGGPGRAGGGEELGEGRGLAFYMQRNVVHGDRGLLGKMYGQKE